MCTKSCRYSRLSLKDYSLVDRAESLATKVSGVLAGWVRDSSRIWASSRISYFLMPFSSISRGLTSITPSR